MLKLNLVFILFLLLVSCEKSTTVAFKIKNISASPIIVSGHDLIHNWAIQDTILVGEEKQLSMWTKFGKDLNYFLPVTIFGDDLLVLNTQGDTLKKDYKNLDNWHINIDEERTVAIHNYFLEIQTVDFN